MSEATLLVDGASRAPSVALPAAADGGRETRPVGVRFEDVSVDYRGVRVLDRFSVTVARGEIMALIGPSGSGKTTALRSVVGFTRPTSGRIVIGERDVTHLPPYARGIGMVVQNYALFPHMKVADNVAFGLRARGERDRGAIAARVADCLRLVGMSQFAARHPRELSGGQQQRVAIARALAIRPDVLLLDEPLSALDAQIRRQMVDEIGRLHRDLPDVTIIYVTHDQSEALTLADRIAILRDGKLGALGASRSLYRAPPNRFSAEFLGNANLLPVRPLDAGDGERRRVDFQGTTLTVSATPQVAGRELLVCVRPHALRLVDGAEATENLLVGRVLDAIWQGDHLSVTVDCNDTTVRLECPIGAEDPRPGDVLRFAFAAGDATLLPEDPPVALETVS